MVELPDTCPFRDGDLVLRCGWGMQSRAVTAAGGSRYSHIGILCFDSAAREWNVIHAVPQENDEGEPEYLKCEPLESFFSPQRACRGGWARIDCDDSTARAAARYAFRQYEKRLVFDNDYLLEDSTQMYCTELVWRAYMSQGTDVSGGRRHDVTRLFSQEGECIFPDDITDSGHTLFINPFKIKQL